MSKHSAVVTGGAQGIGKAVAQQLLCDGYSVLIVDPARDAGEETVQELAGFGEIAYLEGDVADQAVVADAVARAGRMGDGLGALVANAGIGHWQPLDQLTLDDWNRTLAVNLTSAFLLAKYGAAALRRNRGAMVLIASSRAMQSEPNTADYSASKGGIVALTHSLAISLGPEVRVNCVSPGWIATSQWQHSSRRRPPELSPEDHAQHPVGRVGTPPDIAKAVSYLLSADAGFVTGINLVVDGGMTRKMIYV
jgi:NAD(P)-dependent dehydrogenase (short-subunit alcohol dehydrogenase family)